MIIFMTDGILFLKYASKRRLEFPQQADNKKKCSTFNFLTINFGGASCLLHEMEF